MSQAWLFPFENPLKRRISVEFFRELPRSPGIYLMLDASGAVLYVGKAKDLRARVGSYRHAHPDRVSRKVIRLLRLVREIRIEVCSSEKDALLRENALIREHRPAFNVVNASPESYLFIGLREGGPREIPAEGGTARIRLRISGDDREEGGERLYGAFKGRRLVHEGMQALLRLLWATRAETERFEFPARLTRRSPPQSYELEIGGELLPPLKRLLNGTGDGLLALLTEALLANDRIPAFCYHVIQQDLETLAETYRVCFARTRGLLRLQGVKHGLVAQHELDDLRVHELARLGKIES